MYARRFVGAALWGAAGPAAAGAARPGVRSWMSALMKRRSIARNGPVLAVARVGRSDHHRADATLHDETEPFLAVRGARRGAGRRRRLRSGASPRRPRVDLSGTHAAARRRRARSRPRLWPRSPPGSPRKLDR